VARVDNAEVNRQDAIDAKGEVFREPPRRLDEAARRVLGAAIEVHRTLGRGFLEVVYEDAMMIELELQGIAVERQVPLPVVYKGRPITSGQIDLLVEGELVVELKAVDRLREIHTAQLISYLRAGNFELGLLLNFNVPLLKQGIRRVVFHP
jgi:GxxExxY protein